MWENTEQSGMINTETLLKQTMTEAATIAAGNVTNQINSMLNVTYEVGCIDELSDSKVSNDEKIAILREKVATYDFTDCGLTGLDYMDIVSGYGCEQEPSVIAALSVPSFSCRTTPFYMIL